MAQYRKAMTLALCEGRHAMPSEVEGSIFGNELDPTDLDGMSATVAKVLKDCGNLSLYVTGLTVALGEVVRYCVENQVELTLYHFNRDTGDYYPQHVVRTWNCPFCGGPNIRGSHSCTWCQAT